MSVSLKGQLRRIRREFRELREREERERDRRDERRWAALREVRATLKQVDRPR